MIKIKDFSVLKSMLCPVFPEQSFKIPELFFLPERQMVVVFPHLTKNCSFAVCLQGIDVILTSGLYYL